MVKKITLEEFFEMPNTYIHCDTEEKAKTLLKAFDLMGKTWFSGRSYVEFTDTNWYLAKDKTCYGNSGFFCDIENCKENNYKFFEFEDIDLTIKMIRFQKYDSHNSNKFTKIKYGESGIWLVLPDKVTKVKLNKIFSPENVTEITIGNCVKSIDRKVFRKCKNLTVVNVPNNFRNKL